MAKKYIEVEDAIEAVWDRCDSDKWGRTPKTEEIVAAIKRVPAAEVVEAKHGTWTHYEGVITCSSCHFEVYDDIMEFLGDDVPPFCPWCGADMRGDNDGQEIHRSQQFQI